MEDIIDLIGKFVLILNCAFGVAFMRNYYNRNITILNGVKIFLFCPVWFLFLFKKQKEEQG